MAVRSLRYNSFEGRNWKGATFATDADALAFCETAQIYDRNQQKAIVDLVRRLKTSGLWSKMKAIYPFVGGTASSHKWNLKDPRDVDAAFRLAFNGGWTHSANGALPNGSTGWADTYLQPSIDLLRNSTNYSIYLRTNNTTQAVDLGAWQTTSQEGYTYLYTYISGPLRDYRVNDSGALLRINNPTRTDGYFVATRVNDATTKGWRNTTLEGTGSVPSATVLSQYKIGLGALNGFGAGGTPALYSNRQIAFATIGADTLTDSDASNLYTIVDLYQKRLGRAV